MRETTIWLDTCSVRVYSFNTVVVGGAAGLNAADCLTILARRMSR